MIVMSVPPVDYFSLVCSMLSPMCSKYEHLSEACRTNKTLDHTTDKLRRSLPLTGSIMRHKYPVFARVTHL